jgi:hypothetical protein
MSENAIARNDAAQFVVFMSCRSATSRERTASRRWTFGWCSSFQAALASCFPAQPMAVAAAVALWPLVR